MIDETNGKWSVTYFSCISSLSVRILFSCFPRASLFLIRSSMLFSIELCKFWEISWISFLKFSNFYWSYSIKYYTWDLVSNSSKFDELICNCLFILRGSPMLTPLSESVCWLALLWTPWLFSSCLPTNSFGCLKIPTAKLSGSAATPRTESWVSYQQVWCSID